MARRAGDGASSADDFLAELARWASTERVARAASERSRGRTLADQATAASTWTGLLVDLAEVGAEVTLSAGPGLARTGRLVGVARDFVVLERAGRGPLLMATAAVEVVAPTGTPGRSARAGRRGTASQLTLAAAIEALAGEQSPATVQVGDQSIPGVITACGEDVVTVKSDGSVGRWNYIAVNAISWIEIR